VQALTAFALKLLDDPLDGLSLWQLRDAFARLLDLEDLAGPQEIYAKSSSLTIAEGARAKKDELRLELMKRLGQARRTGGSRSALRRMILDAAPSLPKVPAAAADLHYPRFTDPLDRATRLALALRNLQARRDYPDNPWSWARLAADVERQLARPGLGLRVYSALLRAAEDDSERAEIVLLARMVIDEDEASEREALRAALAPWRAPDKNPETLAAIRVLEAGLAARLGDAAGFASAAAAVEARGGKWTHAVINARIFQALSTGDAAAEREALQKVSPEALLAPERIPMMLPALELAKMSDEAEMVREAGRTALRRAVLESWTWPSESNVRAVLDLSAALGAEDTVPEAWAASVERSLTNVQYRNRVAFFAARHRKDWTKALAAAKAIHADAPRVYGLQVLEGEALLGLGRRREAVAPLETVIRYCKDEMDYLIAVKLLARAKAQ
jgi:hypothetical protein